MAEDHGIPRRGPPEQDVLAVEADLGRDRACAERGIPTVKAHGPRIDRPGPVVSSPLAMPYVFSLVPPPGLPTFPLVDVIFSDNLGCHATGRKLDLFLLASSARRQHFCEGLT
jgi:hypothetical protein